MLLSGAEIDIHSVSYIPQMKKTRGFISGLWAGQCTGPLCAIHLCGKRVYKKSQTNREICEGALSYMKTMLVRVHNGTSFNKSRRVFLKI